VRRPHRSNEALAAVPHLLTPAPHFDSLRAMTFARALPLSLFFFSHIATAQSTADASRRTEGSIGLPTASALRADLGLQGAVDDTPIDDYAPSTPGDSDLGEQLILKQKEKAQRFFVRADTSLGWTDNAARASAGETDDAYWGSTLSVLWMPRVHGNLFATVDLNAQWFLYDQLDALDFELIEGSAGLLYAMPKLAGIEAYANYQFSHLTHEFEPLMQRHIGRAGLRKAFTLNRRQQIITELRGAFDLDNDVDAFKRNEYSARATYLLKLTRELQLGVGYSFTLFDYDQAGREDLLHGVSGRLLDLQRL
jgi:hypothetical protein